MTQNKRKRRTFWQPDSPHIKEWLDNQKDLSVSLQFIITDAIRKYGEGDVIGQYLEQKIHTDITSEPRRTYSEVNRTIKPSDATIHKEHDANGLNGGQDNIPTSTSADNADDSVVDSTVGVMDETVKVNTKPTNEGDVSDEIEAKEESVYSSEANNAKEVNTGDLMGMAVDDVVDTDEEDDPITIMLRDSGSTMA